MTHAKFNFNQLMLNLIFGIRASEPPLRPGEQLKRPGLIGLRPSRIQKEKFRNLPYDDTMQSLLTGNLHNAKVPRHQYEVILTVKLSITGFLFACGRLIPYV